MTELQTPESETAPEIPVLRDGGTDGHHACFRSLVTDEQVSTVNTALGVAFAVRGVTDPYTIHFYVAGAFTEVEVYVNVLEALAHPPPQPEIEPEPEPELGLVQRAGAAWLRFIDTLRGWWQGLTDLLT